MCVYFCVCACICMYMYVDICVYVAACVFVYMYVRVYLPLWERMCACMCANEFNWCYWYSWMKGCLKECAHLASGCTSDKKVSSSHQLLQDSDEP